MDELFVCDPSLDLQPVGPHSIMTRARIALLSSFCLIVVSLLWLDHRPLRLPSREDRGDPSVPWNDTGHPVLLAVHEAALAAASRSETAPPDLEWLNLLHQLFGGCDLISTESLARDPETALRRRELLVLPRRSLSSLDVDVGPRLEAMMREHGVVVFLECPDEPWTEHAGIQLATIERRELLPWPAQETWADPRRLPLVGAPEPLRLLHSLWRYGPLMNGRDTADPILSIVGRPMIWSRRTGRGAWLSSSLDLAALAAALRPQRTVAAATRQSSGGSETFPSSASSPAARPPIDPIHPWIDAWLHASLPSEIAPTPWPRWWSAPAGAAGWLVLTLDTDSSLTANSVRDFPLEDQTPGAATFFVAAPTPAFQLSRERASPGRIGLLARWPGSQTWHDPDAPRQMQGWLGLEPFGTLPGVLEQRKRLEKAFPPDAILPVARLHRLDWPADPDPVWAALVAAKVRVDCSLGPRQGAAYRPLGSAMPFRPLDRRGRVWSIWELPHRLTTGAADDLLRLDRWMRVNAASAQGPMHVRLVTSSFPNPAEQAALVDPLLELAREHRHRPIDPVALCAWWERRSSSQLHWTLRADELRIEIDCRGSNGDDLALALPLRWQDRRLGGWHASWRLTESTSERSFARQVRVFPIPPGRHVLSARYISP